MVLSNVTDEQYADYWQEVNRLTGGATHLMNMFEAYIDKVVQSLPTAKSGTFEAVSDDMGKTNHARKLSMICCLTFFSIIFYIFHIKILVKHSFKT